MTKRTATEIVRDRPAKARVAGAANVCAVSPAAVSPAAVSPAAWTFLIVCGALLAALATPAAGQMGGLFDSRSSSDEPADSPVQAIALPRHRLQLAFPVSGRVAAVHVTPGDRVEAGDVLIELEAKEIAAIVEQTRVRAESRVRVEAAKLEHELARLERDRLQAIYAERSAAPFELEQAVMQEKLRRLQLQLAEEQLAEARSQHEQAKAQLARYRMTAPLSGVVDEVVVDAGEAAEELRPVLELVVSDPLRVDASTPTARTLELSVGDPAWIRPLLEGLDDRWIEGRIIHVAEVADAASDTRLIRVEAPNPGIAPGGVRVHVVFERPAGAAAEGAGGVEGDEAAASKGPGSSGAGPERAVSRVTGANEEG